MRLDVLDVIFLAVLLVCEVWRRWLRRRRRGRWLRFVTLVGLAGILVRIVAWGYCAHVIEAAPMRSLDEARIEEQRLVPIGLAGNYVALAALFVTVVVLLVETVRARRHAPDSGHGVGPYR